MGVLLTIGTYILAAAIGWGVCKLLDLPGKAAHEAKQKQDRYDAAMKAEEDFWLRTHPGQSIPPAVREQMMASATFVVALHEPTVRTERNPADRPFHTTVESGGKDGT